MSCPAENSSMAPLRVAARGQASADLGSQLMTMGKHRGVSFKEVLARDPQYCDWVLNNNSESENFRPLVEFLRTHNFGSEDARRTDFEPAEQQQRTHFQGSRSPPAGGHETLNFGKHRGLTFEEVVRQQPDYCQWILREADSRVARGELLKDHFSALVNYIQASGLGCPSPRRSYSSGSYGGRDPARSQAVPDGTDLISGTWQVEFGQKYKGTTFEQVVVQDKNYCDYIVNQVLHSSSPKGGNMMAFAIYVQFVKFQSGGR
jgi:hypothetical protein